MLALATHEPHFFILREEVTFTKIGQSTEQKLEAAAAAAAAGPAEPGAELIQHSKPFQMIKVSVFREYLERELAEADYSSVGGFQLERAIDDFVLMVAFVILWRLRFLSLLVIGLVVVGMCVLFLVKVLQICFEFWVLCVEGFDVELARTVEPGDEQLLGARAKRGILR